MREKTQAEAPAVQGLWAALKLLPRLALIQLDPGREIKAVPLSPFGNLWAVQLKGGSWAKVGLRRGTTDFGVFRQVFLEEDYRLNRLERWKDLEGDYRAILSRGKAPLILDCGANVGLSTLYFRWRYPEAVVLALEPEKNNFDCLARRPLGEKIMRIRGAVSNAAGTLEIFDPGLGEWGFRTRKNRGQGGDLVRAYRVSDLVREAGRRFSVEPFLAKIDIEGHEEALFSSNRAWVRKFPALILEPHDWMLPGGAGSRHFLRAVAAEKRDFLLAGKNIISLRNGPGGVRGPRNRAAPRAGNFAAR